MAAPVIGKQALRKAALKLADSLGGPRQALKLVQGALDEQMEAAARKDPGAFVAYAARDRHNKPFKMAPFHFQIQSFIPPADDLEHQWQGIIQLPRDHGKTNQLIYRVIWELGHDPTIRIKVVSAGSNLSAKIVSAIQDNIIHNPRVRKVFPHLLPGTVWTGNCFTVQGAAVGEKEYSVEAASIKSIGAGGRADLIVFDDVCDYQNSVRESTTREMNKETFADTWVNLLDPPGRMAYLCTPWHAQDLSAHLLNMPDWDRLVLPAVKEVNGESEVLWPAHWPPEALERRRRSIGDRSFARQFMLRPISDEEIIFSNDVVAPSLNVMYGYGTKEYAEFTEGMPKVMGVDLASSMGHRAAYTVLFTAGIGEDGKTYLVNLIRRRMKHPEVIAMIRREFAKYHHQLVVVESNGYQQSVIDSLEDQAFEISVVPFTTSSASKKSESIGIMGLATAFQKGRWSIPVAHLGDKFDPLRPVDSLNAWLRHQIEDDPVATFLRELTEYPAGKFSDTVMACWFTNHAANLLGSSDAIEAATIVI